MHPIGILRGAPASAHLKSRGEDPSAPIGSLDELSAKAPIYVLSVGRIDNDRLMFDELLNSPDFHISFVHDYRDLWISFNQCVVNAVVMHNSLCTFELAEATSLVRNRWPNAKILIIRSGGMSLDHTLYDQRLHPPVRREALAEQLCVLTDSLRKGENRGNR